MTPRPPLVRKRCLNGHDLTGPNPYYTDRDGSRRCRECQLVRMRKWASVNRRNRPPELKIRPNKYRRWAQQAWAQMSERDRRMVAHGLKALPLERAA